MWGLVGPSVAQRRTFICYVMNSKMNSIKNPKLTSLRPSPLAVLMVEKRMRPLEIAANDSFVGKNLGRLKSDWQRFTARHMKGGYMLMADGHVEFALNHDVAYPPTSPSDYNQPNFYIWNPFGPAN